ncbi:MAG TPA: LysM peptidoglycan-binding domain-containing protein [Mycobacteriales bacterium]|nr:LysM peptidoglycan-binding domain-containing protein [Mycobacteriales bacterium]
MTTPIGGLPSSPVASAGGGTAEAYLKIAHPPNKSGPPTQVPLRFNPTDYKVSKTNTYVEIQIPGLGAPPIQYIRGGATTVTFEALVDTSDTLVDVRTAYVDRLRALLEPDRDLHAPPIVDFVWGDTVLTAVLEKLDVTYQLFLPGGRPLRAKLDIALKEYSPAAVQLLKNPQASPTVEKSYVVRRGDTLASIAAGLYRRPDAWRELARANDITNPRDLRPGQVLTAPRLV